MTRVVVGDDFEASLKLFKRRVQEAGLVREIRSRAHFVGPAEARKLKSLRARRRVKRHLPN